MKSKNVILSLILLIALVFISCSNNEQKQKSKTQTVKMNNIEPSSNKGQAFIEDGVSDKNVLQTAMGSKDFTTLVTAVKAAQVENSLVNAGPLTVFAPNNAAFAKLPNGTVETLLKPENKQKLTNILINHVAPSNYTIKSLKKLIKKGYKLYMASGNYVEVTQKGDDIYVGGAKIIASLKVSNGWIHVVDHVILSK